MSADLASHFSSDGKTKLNCLHQTDDFAASMAAAVSVGIKDARERDGALGPGSPGFRYADTLDEVVELLFPPMPEMAVSRLLVARVGERRFTPQDVRSMESEWHDAIDRRVRCLTGVADVAQDEPDIVPPIGSS